MINKPVHNGYKSLLIQLLYKGNKCIKVPFALSTGEWKIIYLSTNLFTSFIFNITTGYGMYFLLFALSCLLFH